MSKPASTADWDTNSTHLLAPTAGHKTDGYAANEVPASNELNGQLHLIGLWIAYLNAAIIDGNLEVSGTLKVDSTTEFVGAVVADSTVKATDYKLSVDQSIILPASSAVVGTNTRTAGAEAMKGIELTANDVLTFPIPLKVGDIITGFVVHAVKSTDAMVTLHSRLYTSDGAGTETAQGSDQTDARDAPGVTTPTQTGLTLTLGAVQAYLAVWITGTPVNDEVYFCTVQYHR